MANTIKFKRASGSDPSASDLAIGEPGLRTDTAELFFKKDDGTVAKVSGGGGGPNFKYLELRNAANNGAASFPGNDFTLVTSGTTNAITPAAANTLLVSVSGVIQKPNAGTSTSGITGFIVDGSRFKTATNLPAAPDFILYQESGGIGEPSDNTVTSAKIVDGAIVNADINASAAIAKSKLASLDIVNADVNASAAIAGTKIDPDFGSQNIDTNGSISGGVGTLTGLNMNGGTAQGANDATLFVTATNNNDWGIKIDKYNSSATEYGMRIDVGSSANFALQIRGNDSQVFNVAGNGAVTATSYAGDGSNLTGITAGAQGGGGESIFFESENEMNNSYTISTNHNALIAGPLTIASGATLTINSPSVVTIP